MRKSWKSLFKVGSPERESFEDVDKLIVESTAVGALQVNVVTANSPIVVQHTLGRVPKFFTLTESDAAVILYATETDRENWTDKQIIIRSNTTGRIGLCVH